ncbi:hypothetical protein AnigIFM63309_010000 [Aspergillus niger]|nr:hypothetical protein AnigIFM63309_010000 [Aspergillus niger]
MSLWVTVGTCTATRTFRQILAPTHVGWTTDLRPKVSTTTGTIVIQAFEPVYLKPEMGNSFWKFATADGQTIAESTIQ